METVGAMSARSFDVLHGFVALHMSATHAAMLPTEEKGARRRALLPSMAIGTPAMAFKNGPSYAQSLLGPCAPTSKATSARPDGRHADHGRKDAGDHALFGKHHGGIGKSARGIARSDGAVRFRESRRSSSTGNPYPGNPARPERRSPARCPAFTSASS